MYEVLEEGIVVQSGSSGVDLQGILAMARKPGLAMMPGDGEPTGGRLRAVAAGVPMIDPRNPATYQIPPPDPDPTPADSLLHLPTAPAAPAAPRVGDCRLVVSYGPRPDVLVVAVEQAPDWDSSESWLVRPASIRELLPVFATMGIRVKDLTGGSLAAGGVPASGGASAAAPGSAARRRRAPAESAS